MLRRLFNGFLDEIAEATGLQQVGHAFAALANRLGYERSAVLDPAKFAGGMHGAIIFTQRSRTELATFADRNAFRDHPVTRRAQTADAPFLTDAVRGGLAHDAWLATLPPEIREGHTLMLPVHRAGAIVLLCGANGREPDLSPLAQALLHGAAHIVYDRLAAMRTGASDAVPLTNREAECVRLMSLGRSDGEIAGIVGISTRTVRFHLHNAKQKLGVGSRVQALAKLANRRRA